MIEPYTYQAEDVAFSLGLEGVLNANDSGTGKTIEALLEVKEWADHYPSSTYAVDNAYRILVVTKKPAIKHWWDRIDIIFGEREDVLFTVTYWQGLVERTRIECVACGGTGENPAAFSGNENCPECKGRGYKLKAQAKTELLKPWDFILADEIHKASGRNSQQSKALRTIGRKAHFRRGYSASSYNNYPDGLWAVLNYLYPKVYTSYWRWFNANIAYDEVYAKGGKRKFKVARGLRDPAKLKTELAPFTIRRKKKQCNCRWGKVLKDGSRTYEVHNHLDELPDKLPLTTLTVELTPQQRRVYAEMTQDNLAWVGRYEDQPLPAPIAIAKLMRQRQITGAYCEIADGKVRLSEPSAKLDVLDEIIEETDEPIVVFSMFRQMVDLACTRFARDGIEYIRLAGDTPDGEKETCWQQFQDGKGQVFVCTIPTGGESIELYRASTCVFLDRSWTPNENSQAEDRLWRNGQRKGVHPILIAAEGTVDFDMTERLEMKAATFRRLFS